MEKGQTSIEGNHCQHCEKYTMFLIEKYGHKLCPDCANNARVLQTLQHREEINNLEKKEDDRKGCDRCGEKKKDVKFRRTNKLYLHLCEDCLKELAEYKKE